MWWLIQNILFSILNFLAAPAEYPISKTTTMDGGTLYGVFLFQPSRKNTDARHNHGDNLAGFGAFPVAPG